METAKKQCRALWSKGVTLCLLYACYGSTCFDLWPLYTDIDPSRVFDPIGTYLYFGCALISFIFSLFYLVSLLSKWESEDSRSMFAWSLGMLVLACFLLLGSSYSAAAPHGMLPQVGRIFLILLVPTVCANAQAKAILAEGNRA